MQKLNELLFGVLDPPRLIGFEDESKSIVATFIVAIFLAVIWVVSANIYS